ncbi:MAG: lysylphosphatidylglycerol synthase transmembrane domain-containing protein [Solirubrobacterales bacterium]
MLATTLGSSIRSFFDAAGQFFGHLTDISWWPMIAALLCLLGMYLARARAWQNVLAAAYPQERVPFRGIVGAYLAGAGINAVIPARIGDATKIFLTRGQVRHSTYPAITSSFFVQSVFDTTAGVLVFAYALSQGLLPRPPELPDLPAFDIAFWAQNPQLLLFTLTVLGVGFLVTFAIVARRAEELWQRIKQGVVILTQPRRYLREVASWQGIGWLFRFAAFWFFLEAFGIGGSIHNVALVMSVQAISTMLPFTPGGAGAQQALLVATLEGPSRTAVLSFSVGTQIAMAAWSAVLGFTALLLIFRTTKWRDLIHHAESEMRTEEAKADSARAEGAVS